MTANVKGRKINCKLQKRKDYECRIEHDENVN